MLSGGIEIRLKNDPNRSGTLTGKTRNRAGTVMYQVRFPEGTSYQPEYEIEPLSQDDVFTLLEKGRYGRVSDLRRNLSHIQLSGRLANLIYSMDTTNTDFYPYQFKPVLSFLESPANGLLIADEVGLGKTIEAGLIWTEMRARSDARRLLVVCPAMLCEKWKDELMTRFDVDASIINSGELLKVLQRDKHSDPIGRAFICSMQGLRPPKQWRDNNEPIQNDRVKLAQFIEENSESGGLIDLVVIDEAHYFRNPESQTAKLGKLLRGVSEHVILLSATPVNLKEDDLFHLLNLVDPDSFNVKEVFPQVLRANEPLIKAKKLILNKSSTAEEICECLAEARCHKMISNSRQFNNLLNELDREADMTDARRVELSDRVDRINLLRHVVSRTRRAEVSELKVIREPLTESVPLNEFEQDFYKSVTDSVREFAKQTEGIEGFLLASPQRQISSCMYAAAQAWINRSTDVGHEIYEDTGAEVKASNDLSPLIEHICNDVLRKYNIDEIRSNDSKYGRFKDLISTYLHNNRTEKIIVFSYFRKTLSYLSERLKEDGIDNQVLVGGMQQSKQDAIKKFREDPAVSVLLSSEVASEGVDLQFSRLLVNYDLPWNPMKVEQRIGRIDRIGQTADKIIIWNLCYANTIDQKILHRLFDRLEIFERTLGGMEAILGQHIQNLTYELIVDELTDDQINDRIDQTALAIEHNRRNQDELERQAAHLIAYGGYILQQVQAAHELNRRITEIDLLIYVRDYLNKYCQGHEFLQSSSDNLLFDIKLPAKTAAKLEEFINRHNIRGISRLPSGHRVKCRFVNKLNRSSGSVEVINQFHPLIKYINHELTVKNEAFCPLVSTRVKKESTRGYSSGVYVFAVHLWRFSGLREEELLHSRVKSMADNKLLTADESWNLVNLARVEGEDWLSVANDVDSTLIENFIDDCDSAIDEDYQTESKRRELENADRISFQIESVNRYKERQLKTHRDVLQNLREAGKIRLIPAREGLIRKLMERFSVRVESLKEKSRFEKSPYQVCYGVIHVK